MLDLNNYDLFIITRPDPEWMDDGVRRMPKSREEMHILFKNELKNRKLPFIEVGGNTDERIKQIKSALNGINPEKF